MKNLVKSSIIGVTFGIVPLSSSANNFHDRGLQKQTHKELFENFDKNNPNDIQSTGSLEQVRVIGVEPKLIVDAVLNYFDEDVKLYKLSPQARQKLIGVLNSYLKAHPILAVSSDGKMEFVIDNKKSFGIMVKQFVSVVMDDMPFFVRKIVIPVFFGGNDAIQQKLDNLDDTVMNLKEKQYKDVVFDYIGGIVKRVAKTVDGKMTVKEYYDDVSGYYPNKNGSHILQELDEFGQADINIKGLKYPFKK